MSRLASVAVLLALVVADVHAAYPPRDVPSTFPHDYPGKPSGDFSPVWQSYFEVNGSLPNVTWELPRNFAGNIPVNRAGHPNDTLFFWAFEKENGSLTASANDRASEPWGIWLNGGPGSSSLIGLTSENGPIHINADFSAQQNNFSWDRLADYVWVDQPVGVGFSTADSAGFVHDEDEMGRDFMGFLSNLVKVFPSLKTRPLYVTGESYAGTYIPYIMKTYFGLTDPPVNIAKFAIGDGTVGSFEVFELLPTVTTIETYPQLIGYDPAVFEFFREQTHLCGYDLNLTYPQNGHFPTLTFVEPSNNEEPFRSLSRFNSRTRHETRLRAREVLRNAKRSAKIEQRDSVAVGAAKKRDLSGRANGTIDPWYGCDIYDEMIDYAVNFSAPWNAAHDNFNGFDVYQVPDALDPEANMDASFFFNDAKTRAALHAPTSKNWTGSIFYPFLGDPLFEGNDPSVEPMAFLTDLAANASAHNVSVILYSGNDDSLVAHRGTEVVIQNTTFGGIQGFTRQPSTPWIDDNGDVGGIVHQERNWTYVLIEGAGHLVPYTNPGRGFVLLREFILGNNQTGLVTNSSGTVNVVGGESSALAVDAIPGQLGIFVGSGTTQSTYTFPSATIAAWSSYIATATVIPPGGLAASGSGSATGPKATGNGAARGVEACVLLFALSLGVVLVVGGAL
ncbi:alpha/beta-hydrolase [Trametes versicolor FP-101664 SS1]|uniref:alpha/beta-hydrolase n=1 Tax=Trametes versicolor (strain FP-101664) TaxID=717944 RepID=UPI000462198D|nr:alpha/beta-hydrolase [Trametes versicolor FP-101664 SS1]EIW58500.1 alpha/beta-hydrolase [Trametes versicolor FP-101664 SS1]